MKYKYSSIIGDIVFDNQFHVVERGHNIFPKYPNLQEPDERHKAKIQVALRDKKFFAAFVKENLAQTKQDVKRSVTADNHIVHAVNLLEELDTLINTVVKRLREWYELWNPEFSKSIQSHEKICELIVTKKNEDLLKEINIDRKHSMGAEIAARDQDAILQLARRCRDLYTLRNSTQTYAESLLQENYPNLCAVAGSAIAGKLLGHAGTGRRLVMMPASTIQLLGAEKALFRHMRNKRSPPPKYGLLFQHPFVQSARKSEQGKHARALADKLSMAVKIDYFKGVYCGDRLKKELEEKFNK